MSQSSKRSGATMENDSLTDLQSESGRVTRASKRLHGEDSNNGNGVDAREDPPPSAMLSPSPAPVHVTTVERQQVILSNNTALHYGHDDGHDDDGHDDDGHDDDIGDDDDDEDVYSNADVDDPDAIKYADGDVTDGDNDNFDPDEEMTEDQHNIKMFIKASLKIENIRKQHTDCDRPIKDEQLGRKQILTIMMQDENLTSIAFKTLDGETKYLKLSTTNVKGPMTPELVQKSLQLIDSDDIAAAVQILAANDDLSVSMVIQHALLSRIDREATTTKHDVVVVDKPPKGHPNNTPSLEGVFLVTAQTFVKVVAACKDSAATMKDALIPLKRTVENVTPYIEDYLRTVHPDTKSQKVLVPDGSDMRTKQVREKTSRTYKKFSFSVLQKNTEFPSLCVDTFGSQPMNKIDECLDLIANHGSTFLTSYTEFFEQWRNNNVTEKNVVELTKGRLASSKVVVPTPSLAPPPPQQ